MSRMETTNDTKRNLPDGWRWVKLGEVIAEAQAGFACGLRDPQGIAQIRMNNVDTRGNFVWDDVLRVPHEANDIEQFQIVPGDVLFNNTNSTELVGKSAVFEGYVEPIVYSNHFTRLRTVTKTLLPDFLASWLNHQWQKGVFAAICNRWIGQSAVKADKLLNLDFPLPPLSEQRRIAEVLREQMTAVEKARAAAQARLEAVKTLPASLLRQVFPQPGQSLPDGWRSVRLAELATVISGQHILESDYNQSGRGIGYLTGPADFGATKPAITNRMFLFSFLITRFNHFQKNAMGATVPGLSREDLEMLEIPLPPLDEQQRIAAVLREQVAAVAKARASAEEELQTISALPAALLCRAFNGEL